jgi:hypothetical protein
MVSDGGELIKVPYTHQLDSPKRLGIITDGLGKGIEGIEELIGQHTNLIDDEGFDATPFFHDPTVFEDSLDNIVFWAFT